MRLIGKLFRCMAQRDLKVANYLDPPPPPDRNLFRIDLLKTEDTKKAIGAVARQIWELDRYSRFEVSGDMLQRETENEHFIVRITARDLKS